VQKDIRKYNEGYEQGQEDAESIGYSEGWKTAFYEANGENSKPGFTGEEITTMLRQVFLFHDYHVGESEEYAEGYRRGYLENIEKGRKSGRDALNSWLAKYETLLKEGRITVKQPDDDDDEYDAEMFGQYLAPRYLRRNEMFSLPLNTYITDGI